MALTGVIITRNSTLGVLGLGLGLGLELYTVYCIYTVYVPPTAGNLVMMLVLNFHFTLFTQNKRTTTGCMQCE